MQGLLAAPDPYYERLSEEGRRFLAKAMRKPVAPSSLYDPILHRVPASGVPGAEDGGEIDWECIGGTLAARPQLSQAREQEPLAVAASAWGRGLGHNLLLSDTGAEVEAAPEGVGAGGTAASGTAAEPALVRRLTADGDA